MHVRKRTHMHNCSSHKPHDQPRNTKFGQNCTGKQNTTLILHAMGSVHLHTSFLLSFLFGTGGTMYDGDKEVIDLMRGSNEREARAQS